MKTLFFVLLLILSLVFVVQAEEKGKTQVYDLPSDFFDKMPDNDPLKGTIKGKMCVKLYLAQKNKEALQACNDAIRYVELTNEKIEDVPTYMLYLARSFIRRNLQDFTGATQDLTKAIQAGYDNYGLELIERASMRMKAGMGKEAMTDLNVGCKKILANKNKILTEYPEGDHDGRVVRQDIKKCEELLESRGTKR